jgi:rod shape-determining protein MreD
MKNIVAFLLLWLGLIIQSTVFQIRPLNVFQPNLVLIILVVIAATRGTRAALCLGILIGFIQDAEFGSFLGLYAFSYGVVGYFAAATFTQFMQRNVAITFFVSVVSTFVIEWMTYGLTRMFDVTGFTWITVVAESIRRTIENGITLLLLYPLLVRICQSPARSRYSMRRRREVL